MNTQPLRPAADEKKYCGVHQRSLLGLPPNAENFGPSSDFGSTLGFGGGLSCTRRQVVGASNPLKGKRLQHSSPTGSSGADMAPDKFPSASLNHREQRTAFDHQQAKTYIEKFQSLTWPQECLRTFFAVSRLPPPNTTFPAFLPSAAAAAGRDA